MVPSHGLSLIASDDHRHPAEWKDVHVWEYTKQTCNDIISLQEN